MLSDLNITQGLGILIGGIIIIALALVFSIGTFKSLAKQSKNTHKNSIEKIIVKEQETVDTTTQVQNQNLTDTNLDYMIKTVSAYSTDDIDPKFIQKYEQNKIEYNAKVAIYEGSIEAEKHFKFPYLKLAELHREYGFFKKALDVYAKAMEVFDKDAEIILEIGSMQMELGNFDGALMTFSTILETDPTSWQALMQMGLCYALMEDKKNAINYTQKALDSNPNNPDILNNLGLFYYHDNQIENAINILKQALSINPSHIGAIKNYQLVLSDKEALVRAGIILDE